MATIKITNAVTGETTERETNSTMNAGDRFQLIGHSMMFVATRVASVLSDTMLVVHGVSTCGKFRTSARIEDTFEAE